MHNFSSPYSALAMVGAAMLAAASLAACGDDDHAASGASGSSSQTVGVGGSGAGGGGAGGAGGGSSLTVEWEPCSLITEGSGSEAECATIEVRLFWERPAQRTIELFLKRMPGSGEPAGQVWFLAGGPGQSGVDIEPLVQLLASVDTTKTYYMLDHRGVGRSTRLSCPESEDPMGSGSISLAADEVADCIAHLATQYSQDELRGFSTREAARDVGELIETLRAKDETVTVWGGSYGTNWIEGYLDQFPNQPDAAVFSAIALDADLLRIEQYYGGLGLRWFDACDANASCGARFQQTFGKTAKQTANDLLSGKNKELCAELVAEGWSASGMKFLFGSQIDSWEQRKLIAPIVYRATRCSPADVQALTTLAKVSNGNGQPGKIPIQFRLWGWVLAEHIATSELTSNLGATAIQSHIDNGIAAKGVGLRLAASKKIWPSYKAPKRPLSAHLGRTIFLHGQYDFLPQDAYQNTLDHYLDVHPQNSFTLITGAPHSLESPMQNGNLCGLSMAVSPLLSPAAPLPDCLNDIVPIGFEPDAATAMVAFGSNDPWGDAKAASAMQTVSKAQLAAARADLEQVVMKMRLNAPAAYQRLQHKRQRVQ